MVSSGLAVLPRLSGIQLKGNEGKSTESSREDAHETPLSHPSIHLRCYYLFGEY